MLLTEKSDRRLVHGIARLHKRQFINYDIVSSCTVKLLKSFYEYISGLESTILITEKVNNMTVGFIYVNVGNTKPVQYFIKKNLFRILLNPFSSAQVFKSFINSLFRSSRYKYENELVYIAVANEYAGRGIATRLIKESEQELRKRNIKEYYLQVLTGNERAVRLYQQLDFKIVKMLKRIGPDKFIMKKELT